MSKIYLGRHVYGVAAIAFGVITLVWGDFNSWQQIGPLGNVLHREMLAYIAAALDLAGGIAIQRQKTMRAGAALLGIVYLSFALLWVPNIVATPRSYDPWGNFFEQFSIFSGALIVYGAGSRRNKNDKPTSAERVGYIFFGVCVISFTLEQLIYLSGTASFVPKWIPPGQMFWAAVTTVALGLAAIALLARRAAQLASRLLTVMLAGFGLLVWLPRPFANPHELFNWAGNAQNWAITGAAWIVADLLAQTRAGATEGLNSSIRTGIPFLQTPPR